jgi:hypothetical protein
MEEEPQYVCVLDMDETLGKMMRETFAVRPYVDLLVDFLRLCRFDIILWSLGTDEYVHRIVNGHLLSIKRYATKIFARKECNRSKQKYGYDKASEHVRVMYDRDDVFLMGVDDKVNENMDSGYDVRIYVSPYIKPNARDKVLLDVVEKIVTALVKFKDERGLLPLPVVIPDGNQEACIV